MSSLKISSMPEKTKKAVISAAAIIFWLAVWELTAVLIPEKLLFASPFTVLKKLAGLAVTSAFWKAVAFSSLRIALGFIFAFFAGILLAVLSYMSKTVKVLISPLLRLMKAVPVAGFIILALLWFRKENLSVLISFVMVLPVIYANVLQGIESADKKLLEMARVFKMKASKKLRFIYLPSVMPSLCAGCSVALGFSWKSGIAAEVIGIPTGSIGEKLYEAKLYLMTGELFAWTLVIVILSVIFEKAVMLLLRKLAQKLS